MKSLRTQILTHILFNYWMADFTYSWFALADLFLPQPFLKMALRHTK